jgi:hypothetical protein
MFFYVIILLLQTYLSWYAACVPRNGTCNRADADCVSAYAACVSNIRHSISTNADGGKGIANVLSALFGEGLFLIYKAEIGRLGLEGCVEEKGIVPRSEP